MFQFVAAVLSFVLVLILIRRKVDLGFAMMLAAFFLGVASGLGPARLVNTAVSSVLSLETLNLALVLVLILLLENVMDRLGLLDRMVSSLGALVMDRRIVMASLPALIGFLPSAGGALFSAPMVESAAGPDGEHLVPEKKAFINYWYRHIWEYTLPMYPAVVLSSRITELPLGQIMRVHGLITAVAILAGIPFAFVGLDRRPSGTGTVPSDTGKEAVEQVSLGEGLRGTAPTDTDKEGKEGTGLKRNADLKENSRVRRLVLKQFLGGVLPIIAVISLVVVFNLEITLAAAIVLISLILTNLKSWEKIRGFHHKAWAPRLFTLVIGLMLFKGMIQAAGTAEALPGFFSSLGIPAWILPFLIPFPVGLLTGYSPAVVAISFPLILPFLPSGSGALGRELLAYVAGFTGVLLSPTHLCLLLTAEYFRADLAAVYRLLLLPVGILMATAFLLSFTL
ncbi:MAG TPA: DUF401 family protein [Clostridia bacterium]|nr:DUF401 family protein [Clostridia bacterium]